MPVPAAPAVPTAATAACSAFASTSIQNGRPTAKPETLSTLMLVAPALVPAARVVGPGAPVRKTIELLFSRTALAVPTLPTSQPARANGTHGAGAFRGAPVPPSATESAFSMLKLVSADGVGGSFAGLPLSTASVQYLNEDEKPTDPSARKKPYAFDTAWPVRSGYRPVSELRIPPAVWEISTVWSFVSSVPLSLMKLSRFGICSRSDGTLGLSRRKCVLSNWM